MVKIPPFFNCKPITIYFQENKNSVYLFEGQEKGKAPNERSLNLVFKQAI
jgi:hypothetical protein